MLLVFVVCCLLFVNSSVPSEHDTGTQWLCGDVSSEVLEARILQQFCNFNPLLVTASLWWIALSVSFAHVPESWL